MEQISICKQSGSRATEICEPIELQWIQKNGLKTEPCKYHKIIHTDLAEKFRVNGNCENVNNMKHVSWFVLPPSMEWYYKSKNPSYKELPPYRFDCENTDANTMDIIYPKHFSKIYVPVELNGNIGKTIFEVAHRKASKKIYWHLDGVFIAVTQNNHQMALSPDEGVHVLTLVDEDGETLTQKFEIIGKK
jgi:penicillin-binding protein 1C